MANFERDVLILRLRDAIADKEMVIANANGDTAKLGFWSTDYNDRAAICSEKIETLLEACEAARKPDLRCT